MLTNQMKFQNTILTTFLLAAAGAHAGDVQKVCTFQMSDELKSESVKIKPTFTAAICPPSGKTVAMIYGAPNDAGWIVNQAKAPDTRFFVTPSKDAVPTNLMITFSGDSQTELVLVIDKPAH